MATEQKRYLEGDRMSATLREQAQTEANETGESVTLLINGTERDEFAPETTSPITDAFAEPSDAQEAADRAQETQADAQEQETAEEVDKEPPVQSEFNLESLTPGITEVEEAMHAFAVMKGLPYAEYPAVLVYPKSDGIPNRFKHSFNRDSWATRDGKPVTEVSFPAEDGALPPRNIIDHGLHALAHMECKRQGLVDMGNSGRHTKDFKKVAEEMGLEVTDTKNHGPAITAASDETWKQFEKVFVPDVDAFNVFKQAAQSVTRGKGSSLLKWECRNGHDNSASRVISSRGAIDQGLPCPVCLYDALKGEGMADKLIKAILDVTKLQVAAKP
jgi:hypothetical protein